MRQLNIPSGVPTDRSSESIDRYFKDVGKHPLISVEEEVRLGRLVKQGDKEARDKLVTANLRFVISVAKQYQGQGLGLPDLVNDGNEGLIKAAQRFDETKGPRFISYAVWWIRQSIQASLGYHSDIVRLPAQQYRRRKRQAKEDEALEQRLATAAPGADFSVYLDKRRLDHEPYRLASFSLDKPYDEEGRTTLKDTMHDTSFSPPDEQGHPYEDIIRHALDHKLSPLSRTIVMFRHGFEDGEQWNFNEIAAEIGYTSSRVSQLYRHASRKLRKELQIYLSREV